MREELLPHGEPRGLELDLMPLARDLLRGRQDAEDLAQDAWVLLRRQPPGRVRSLRSWLNIAILHLGMRSRRRDKRRAERERIVAKADCFPSVVELLEMQAQQELLAEQVGELGEPYREVVRLRYLEDLGIEEIAARVRRSPGTVRSQLKRGLDQLRARLGVEPSGRRKPWVLVPWPWRVERRSDRKVDWRLALVSGTAGMIVLAVVLRETRTELGPMESVVRAEDPGPAVTLSDPTRDSGRSALAADVRDDRSRLPELETDAWGIEVAGRVIDPEGRPVPGAAILVGSREGGEPRVAARSDDSGHFELGSVDRRRLIWAEHPARIPSERHLLATKNPDRGLDLRLGYPLGSLVGRVVSFDGRPVPGAEVELIGSADRFEFTDQGTLALGTLGSRALTEADGSFRLGQHTRRNFRLLVRSDEHPPVVVAFQRTQGADQEVKVTLPAPSALVGLVVRSDGTPAAGVRLELRFLVPLPGFTAVTDERGGFDFEALPSGPYALRLVEDPAGVAQSCCVEGTLTEGEVARQTVGLDEVHTIHGRALEGESPLAGWTVEVDDLNRAGLLQDIRSVQTAVDGSFAIPSCSLARAHVLRLFAPEDREGIPRAIAREVRADGKPVMLRADPPGSLVGAFESTAPRLRPLMAALRSDSFSTSHLLLVDPETGEFSAPRLPSGRHALLAWVPGVGVWDAGEVEIFPERRTEHFARIPEPGTLRIHVDSREPVPMERLAVSTCALGFHSAEGTTLQWLPRSQASNEFQVDLFPGMHTYFVNYGGLMYETRQVSLETGMTTEDTILLEETVPMTLCFRFPRAMPAEEGILLTIRTSDREERLNDARRHRNGRAQTVNVLLARDTKELLVRTTLGLTGRLALTEADIVAGGVLEISLQESVAGEDPR